VRHSSCPEDCTDGNEMTLLFDLITQDKRASQYEETDMAAKQPYVDSTTAYDVGKVEIRLWSACAKVKVK
jgi:hypothetical protein